MVTAFARSAVLLALGALGLFVDRLDAAERRRLRGICCAGCGRCGEPLCAACFAETGTRLALAAAPALLRRDPMLHGIAVGEA